MKYSVIAMSLFVLSSPALSSQDNEIYSEKHILESMKAATDWQLDNLFLEAVQANGGSKPVFETGWIRGVFYTGVMATYRATGDEKYLDIANEWGTNNNWEFGERKKHADDQVVGQTYAELYQLEKDEIKIREMTEVYDYMIATPEPGLITGWSKVNNWKWCDALYMAPPAMAKLSNITGDPKYRYLMNTMWWETYLHLYDKEEHLFYRDDRYVWDKGAENVKTKNGNKVFWGRGNGWVLAGLARLISQLPKDYTTYKSFVTVFKEMSTKIAEVQGEDGLWRTSLLDENDYPSPETSSTGFFLYAITWGINQGILDRETFYPVVDKAWKGLNKYMGRNGKLGFVQQVGHDPRVVSEDDSMEYGTAAFLLSAEQILILLKEENATRNN